MSRNKSGPEVLRLILYVPPEANNGPFATAANRRLRRASLPTLQLDKATEEAEHSPAESAGSPRAQALSRSLPVALGEASGSEDSIQGTSARSCELVLPWQQAHTHRDS